VHASPGEDWIENLLGLNMHSADSVLPEFQSPQVDETIALGANQMRLERVEPERVLGWRSLDGNWVWTFVLAETDGRTRLVSRNRLRLPALAGRVGMLAMEPASLVIERKNAAWDQAARRAAGGRPGYGSAGEPRSAAAGCYRCCVTGPV
jgi:hypothetical protein